MAYNPHVSRGSIELLTEKLPQSSIFDLVEAAFRGDKKRTMALYDEQRALKVEPQQIIAMLAWQLHVLAVVKTAGGRSADDIAREAKLNPYVVRKTQALARQLSVARLKQLVTALRAFDIRTKTESVLPDEVVRFYLIHMTT
jgi:DNA polymerase III delta subunit